MNKDFSLLDVLKVLGRWKKHILITTGVVGLLSIIGSLTMPNYYEASTTFYAAHPDLAKPEPVGGEQSSKFIYGTGDDLDRLFSVANSSNIRDYIVKEFGLYSYYDIDSTKVKGQAKMAKKFDKLYKTELTKYDAMTLSIEDENPKMALKMVTAAREKLSSYAQTMVKESQKKTLDVSKTSIRTQETALATINDSLNLIKGKYGVVDSKSQGEVFAQMITSAQSALHQGKAQLESMKKMSMHRDSIRNIKAKIAGLESKTSSLKTSVENYNEGILQVLALEQQQRRLYDEISLEKERFKKLMASYKNPFTALHIVEKESLPVEKSRPKRSLIVFGLTVLAFILSCLGALLFDSTKDINWKEIYHG